MLSTNDQSFICAELNTALYKDSYSIGSISNHDISDQTQCLLLIEFEAPLTYWYVFLQCNDKFSVF